MRRSSLCQRTLLSVISAISVLGVFGALGAVRTGYKVQPVELLDLCI
jgi:hypothetical protein